VTHNPLSIPDQQLDQPRCEFCGESIPAGDRRPRQFCSAACRQADYRKRRLEGVVAEKATKPPGAENNEQAAVSPEISENFSNDFKGHLLRNSTPSAPLDLFGRGYRWPGAKANGNAVRIAAAIDAELVAGAEWLTSPDGVRHQVIPSRRPR
jgi:endogenous inhibitor of DNA gyrase (YacG/DUF329 family)